MSEIITAPGGGTFPVFGLEVMSQGPVTLRTPPDAPAGTVQAIGSNLVDSIQPISIDSTTPFLMSGQGGDDRLSGAAGNDQISGGDGKDVIFGNGGDDTVLGGDADDTISGGSGNDTLFGESGRDLINGEAGNDEIDGGAGKDRLLGGAGNDVIVGGRGNDVMSGGAGADRLTAGQGFDVLTGGGGRDIYVLGAGSASQLDKINDFNPKDDTIFLDQSLLPGSGLGKGKLRVRDFKAVDTLTDNTTAKIVYEKRTGIVFYKPVGGTQIALLQLEKNLPITAADFRIDSGL